MTSQNKPTIFLQETILILQVTLRMEAKKEAYYFLFLVYDGFCTIIMKLITGNMPKIYLVIWLRI